MVPLGSTLNEFYKHHKFGLLFCNKKLGWVWPNFLETLWYGIFNRFLLSFSKFEYNFYTKVNLVFYRTKWNFQIKKKNTYIRNFN